MADPREALIAHLERTGMGYGLHDGLRREFLSAWADSILAEFDVTPRGERVKPTVEDVAAERAHQEAAGRYPAPLVYAAEYRQDAFIAGAQWATSLLPGRTEAEVKAEALREAAEAFINADVFTTEEQREFAAWLMVRANNTEREADRG